MLYSSIWVSLIQFGMMGCVFYAISTNENGEYGQGYAHSFMLFLVKFPCALALHLYIYPEISKGLSLMKFANNNPELFVENGSEISFLIGMVQYITSNLTEFVNLYLLAYQHSISHSIIHFVALEVVAEVSVLYYESQEGTNHLLEVMHHHPKIMNRGCEIDFKDRSCFHKLFRVLYRGMRCFYVSVNFYFLPFLIFYIQWMTPIKKGAH